MLSNDDPPFIHFLVLLRSHQWTKYFNYSHAALLVRSDPIRWQNCLFGQRADVQFYLINLLSHP